MDDDDAAGTPPPDGGDSGGGQEPPGDAGSGQGAGDTDGEDLDAKALMAEVRALRRENAKWRTGMRDLEAKLQQHEDEKLTESERVKRENEALKAELARRDADKVLADRTKAIREIATAKRAIDPELVADLLVARLDPEAEIAPAVDALLKERPYLRAAQGSGGDAAGSASASQDAGQGEETDDERRARIYSGGGNIFDPKFAQKHGGGVVISSPEKVVRR